MELQRHVDLETARGARGVRMVVWGVLPSPWGEAAKGLFQVKEIPALLVRFKRDDAALAAWTGARNAPSVMYDDEPARTGWAEILELAERLGGARRLVPAEAAARVRLFGLAHELAGEGGLGWQGRLLMIHGSLDSAGARSFPLPVAQHLAPRYGYAPDRVPAARRRLVEILTLFDRQLAAAHAAGHRYLMGAELTALDLYLATFLTSLVALPEADCPRFAPALRPAFAYLHEELGAQVPAALAAHRAFIYQRHLPWPIAL